jgi:hypothetical protein
LQTVWIERHDCTLMEPQFVSYTEYSHEPASKYFGIFSPSCRLLPVCIVPENRKFAHRQFLLPSRESSMFCRVDSFTLSVCSDHLEDPESLGTGISAAPSRSEHVQVGTILRLSVCHAPRPIPLEHQRLVPNHLEAPE